MPYTDPNTGQTLYTPEEGNYAAQMPGSNDYYRSVKLGYLSQTPEQNAYVYQRMEQARVASLTQEQRQAEAIRPQIEALRSMPMGNPERWAQYVDLVNQYSKATGIDQSYLITQAIQGSGITHADIARMATGGATQSQKQASAGLSPSEASAGYTYSVVSPGVQIGTAAKYETVQKNGGGIPQTSIPEIGTISEKSGTTWTGTGWVNQQAPQVKDIIARSDVYSVTDPRQLALMKEKGLTSYEAAAELLKGATTLQEKLKYETALTQAWTTQTGKSAEYHRWAGATGLPQATNPYEYAADLFTYAMKGYPVREAERFSPVDYTALELRDGKGQQAYAWGTTGYDLTGAMGVIARAEKSGDMGIYGMIPAPTTRVWDSAMGEYVVKDLSLAEQQAVGLKSASWFTYPDSVWKEPRAWVGTLGVTELTFKTPSMYKSSAYEVIQKSQGSESDKIETPTGTGITNTDVLPAGFESWLSSSNKQVADILGFSNLPKTTPEQVKGTAPYLMGFGPTASVGVALQTPVLKDYIASYFAGEVQAMREQPVTMGISAGVGVISAGALKGLGVLGEASRASFAEKAISEGGIWRAAETFVPAATKAIPATIGAMYATSVAERTTTGGTDLSPAAAGRFGGIVATEVRPMTFGAMTLPTAYEAARMSDIGYKSALQEGFTKGRLQYYITEPATKPIGLAKIDYAAYAQETTAVGGKPTIPSYLVERAGFNVVPASEPVRSVTPPESEFATGYVYDGKTTSITDLFGFGKTPAPEVARPAVQPELEFATGGVYGKQPTVFETISKTGERAVGLAEIRVKAFAQEAPGKATSLVQSVRAAPIAVKSYLQETKPFESLVIGLKYPAAEIAQYNLINTRFAEAYGGKGAAGRAPITPLSKTFGFQMAAPAARVPTDPAKPFTETRGSSGQVAVLESPSSIAESTSRVTETGWQGVPEYPARPSPISRQRYRIDEETQYLTLPPGMERPSAQKTQQIQFITPTEMISQRQAMQTRPEQIQRSEQITRTAKEPIPMSDVGRALKLDVATRPVVTTSPIQTSITRQAVTQTPAITPRLAPWTDIVQRPPEEIPTIRPPVTITPMKWPFGGLGAGGGSLGSSKSGRYGLFFERFNVGRGINQETFLRNGSSISQARRGINFSRR